MSLARKIIYWGLWLSSFYGSICLLTSCIYSRYIPGYQLHISGCLMWAFLLGFMAFGFSALRKVVLQELPEDAGVQHWVEPRARPVMGKRITEYEIF